MGGDLNVGLLGVDRDTYAAAWRDILRAILEVNGLRVNRSTVPEGLAEKGCPIRSMVFR